MDNLSKILNTFISEADKEGIKLGYPVKSDDDKGTEGWVKFDRAREKRKAMRASQRGDAPLEPEEERAKGIQQKLDAKPAESKKKAVDIALAKLDSKKPILTPHDIQTLRNHYKDALANNDKTQVAIDFMAGSQKTGGTCYMTCKYCYVYKSINMREGWRRKLMRLTNLIRNYPELYRTLIKVSIEKYIADQAKKGESVDAIRWFGSGDYQPFMKPIMKELAEIFGNQGVKFYVISKTLVSEYPEDIEEIAQLPNVFLNLSFHEKSKDMIDKLEPLRKKYDNIQFCYTLDRFEGVKVVQRSSGKEISREKLEGDWEKEKLRGKIAKGKERAREFEEIEEMMNPIIGKYRQQDSEGNEIGKVKLDLKDSYIYTTPKNKDAKKITIRIRDKKLVKPIVRKFLDAFPDWKLNRGMTEGWTYVFSPKGRAEQKPKKMYKGFEA